MATNKQQGDFLPIIETVQIRVTKDIADLSASSYINAHNLQKFFFPLHATT